MKLFVDFVFLQIYFNRKGRKGLRKGHKDLKKICESVAKKRGLRFVIFTHEISYFFENHTKGFMRKRGKGLRKGHKVFKKICESVAKKTRITICNVCS
jgi:hypothetical protein